MQYVSPLHLEVKFSFKDLFPDSCDKKTGVKLEGKWSSLLPKRLVPLISPKTHKVRWWWHQGGTPAIFLLCPPLTLNLYGLGGGGVCGRTE